MWIACSKGGKKIATSCWDWTCMYKLIEDDKEDFGLSDEEAYAKFWEKVKEHDSKWYECCLNGRTFEEALVDGSFDELRSDYLYYVDVECYEVYDEDVDDEEVLKKLFSKSSTESETAAKVTPKKEMAIVTVAYSFDAETVAIVFDSYEEACSYIKEDFENEKEIDISEGYEHDEEFTYCDENMAVLSTKYRDGIGTTTWTVATVIDKRKKGKR